MADIHGSIHILDKDFESVQSWLAHVGGRVTHMIEKQRVLVTLGVSAFLISHLFEDELYISRKRIASEHPS